PYGFVSRTSSNSIRSIITATYPASQLSKYNHKLVRLAKDGQTSCLPIFDKCREILESNVKPDLTTYCVLLQAHERNNDLEAILRTFEEMQLAGVPPNISAFNIGLGAAATHGDTVVLEKIRDMLHKSALEPNANTYEIIIQGLCANQELEHALDLLGDMTVSVNEKGVPDENGRPTIDIPPTLQCYTPIIQLAVKLHESETAYLVLKMAEVQAGLSRLPPTLYIEVMARAAEDYVFYAVEYCWNKGVKQMGAYPDEGTCMLILNCAGHEKAPRLAAEVIQYMAQIGMVFQEYHFAPLFQAFFLAGKYKSAFNVLSIMRTSGLRPTYLTTTSILKALRGPAQIEEAFLCMKEMHQEGKKVDVVAINILIEAYGRHNDLTRATTIYETAPLLGVEPDTDTYNALLIGCLMNRNITEGRNVITMMHRSGVDPNVDTYQSLINLCLTQINYEDAFMYLEELKSHGVIPPESVYTGLVRKLARENDPRIKYVIEEMESFRYAVGPSLREYIETGGLSSVMKAERRRQIRKTRRINSRPLVLKKANVA
ncbi:hypothetical protein BGZ65_002314, partial [Modicella reniformis]